MKLSNRLFFSFLISSIVLLPLVSSVSVGISPGHLNLGEIEPGDSKIARFYLVTSSKEKMIVHLSSTEGNMNIYDREEYRDLRKNHSEEDISSWVEFINNPTELLPPSQVSAKMKEGLNVEQLREVKFVLRIPEDAEPGYHTGIIYMDPKVTKDEEANVFVKSIVPLTYIFKVKGKAIRSGNIIDIIHKTNSFGRKWVQVFYENNGTVTTYVNRGSIIFYNEKGRIIFDKKTDARFVKPGEIREFNTFIRPGELEDGEYDVKVTFDYTTDSVTRDLRLDLGTISESPTGKVTEEIQGRWEIPWKIIIVILIIILITYIIYKG